MWNNRFFILCSFFFLICNYSVNAQSILWQETNIPMQEAGDKGLETLLVWPNTPGKHPLVLLSHGSPRDAKQRLQMTAISYLPMAMEFARRGFAVAVVMRRGYGHSGGSYAESNGKCNDPSYLHSAFEAAKDLRASIKYLATLPQFDVDHIIPVGFSAGGFATTALTAFSPPKGLVAAISFAGGRGSYAENKVCREDKLIATFGLLGKTSRTPMLWIYSKNDHYFNPKLASQFLKAFKSNGGQATFIQAQAFGTDGHYLFFAAGIPIWTPLVDDFFKTQSITSFKKLLPLPTIAHLIPPSQLSSKNKKSFLTYLKSPPHKAFAISTTGAFGWSSGMYTLEEAKNEALEDCKHYSKTGCHLYVVEDDYMDNNLSR